MKNPVKNLITWSPSHLITSQKSAFTLAEVLITLAIIGVVAAMTIPTLISDYKKKVVETKLLKVYSTVNNAIKLSSVDNGPIESWPNFGLSSQTTATYDDALAWCNKYLIPYMRILKTEKYPDNEYVVIYLPDGSLLLVANYIYDTTFYTDANALQNPKTGINNFRFRLGINIDYSKVSTPEKMAYSKLIKGFEPYVYAWDGTYEGAKYSTLESPYGCYENYKALCTKLIQLNGWKIPDDYPYNF